MKKITAVALISIVPLLSCGIFRNTISIQDVIKEKIRMDASENPAQKYVIKQQLSDKKVKLVNVTVKDVIASTNIDYDFCVVVDVDTPNGKVECYIYTTNVNKISKLKKGTSKIDAVGEFGRFFSLLDEYYTKIEIVGASITIKG